jgi:arsenate reductase-like glutaredoxin family protein
MVREADLKKAGLEPSLELLASEPKYIQRPILVSGDGKKAVVGRPPETILSLLSDERSH